MISSNVSRLTLNGMFLITMAVGITSSSPLMLPLAALPDVTGGDCIGTCSCDTGGGEPPDEMSELDGGDIERESLAS